MICYTKAERPSALAAATTRPGLHGWARRQEPAGWSASRVLFGRPADSPASPCTAETPWSRMLRGRMQGCETSGRVQTEGKLGAQQLQVIYQFDSEPIGAFKLLFCFIPVFIDYSNVRVGSECVCKEAEIK